MSKRRNVPEKHPSSAAAALAAVWRTMARPASGALVIAAAKFAAYLPSINGGFLLDDGLLLTENRLIAASDGPYRLWCTTQSHEFYPLSYTSNWLEWRLWKMHTAGYHVTNLILHAAESLLLWIVLRRLSIPGAFLAALIFALHPVNVESVAWIAQRRNIMALLFFLLSILWYLKFAHLPGLSFSARRLPIPQQIRHPSSFILHHSSLRYCYCLSLAAFLLAMLGKGSAVVLPLALLGIVYWFQTTDGEGLSRFLCQQKWDCPFSAHATSDNQYEKVGSRSFRRALLPLAPFFAIALALTLANVWFQTHGGDVVYRRADFAERLAGAGGVVWFYLCKALLPIDLCFIYPTWHIQTHNLLGWAPLLAALAVTAVLWLYRKCWARPLFFAWAFFCATLVPVMGFTDVGFMKFSLVADHYLHIAIIALIVPIAAGCELWRQSGPRRSRRAALSVAIVAVAVLFLLTWRQNTLFSGEIPLYQDTLSKNPRSWRIQNNLGIAMLRAGRVSEAVENFKSVLEINPDFVDARINLGNTLFQAGQAEAAIEQIRQALASKPDSAAAHFNLGKIFARLGRTQDAVDEFEQAARLKPDFPDAHLYLGDIFFADGRTDQAIERYRQAVRLKPELWAARSGLATALAKIGDLQQAVEQLHEALRINPDLPEAWFELANVCRASGQAAQAVDFYRQALALRPDYLEAHNNLGIVLFQANQAAEAVEQFSEVLRLKPDDINAHNNLAAAYASLGQSTEAVAAAQKALELARSQNQPALAERIEKWLIAYRASLSTGPSAQPQDSAQPQP